MTIDARAFRDEGREAFEVYGRSVHENPYAGADQAQFDLWLEGHLEARGDAIRAMRGTSAWEVAMDALCEVRRRAPYAVRTSADELLLDVMVTSGEVASHLQADEHFETRRSLVRLAAQAIEVVRVLDQEIAAERAADAERAS